MMSVTAAQFMLVVAVTLFFHELRSSLKVVNVTVCYLGGCVDQSHCLCSVLYSLA